ncbi:hypothetical protein QQF64_020090 [Cirrhinus molitorella]|uniref:Uncharacterized protein n=1 Tax=Cirrhinus molitorella TaxID=172907 RepID=A0ABR3LKP4_9TELE
MSNTLEEEARKIKYLENVIDFIMDGNSSDLEQLEEEDDEELIPQAMHDDGSSDSSDEEDYQEESVVQNSIEVEVPTTHVTIIKQSVKDNAKKEEYRWRKQQF